MQPFTNSRHLLTKPDALHAQMRQEGYLFLPGLLKSATVGEVRNAILAICQEKGWVDATGRAQEPARLEGAADFWEVYDPLQKLEVFHALAHQPEILGVIETLVQEPAFVHPRNIARITFPDTDHFTTPAHQDYVHIQGTPDVYTAWFPLMACPQALGSLVVLAGSHRQGVLPVHKASGAGGLGIDTDGLGLTWHGSDFAAGDVLLFHSHTVHKALPNHSADQLRISVDYRYQGLSQPLVEDGLDPHYRRLTWDQIYSGWANTQYQYYWRKLPIKTVTRDRSYHQNAKPR